jgi:uncharacterized repeat protein (TIGR03803 family)
MTKPKGWRIGFVALMLLAATAIASNAQTFNTLASFDNTNGKFPYYVSLVQGTDGNFYGTTSEGVINNDSGTVFKITPTGTLTTIYAFCSQSNCTDGLQPFAGLVLGTDGNFYGTTWSGGANDWGTVFKITPTGTLTTLYSFCSQTNCADGSNPKAGLVLATDGNFYGTTYWGGANTCDFRTYDYGCGTVFKITPSGKLTTLHSLDRTAAYPIGGLVQATDGNFYGTTYFGGVWGGGCEFGCGTVFRITPTGTLTILHNFGWWDAGGRWPTGTMMQATDGELYGTTERGGVDKELGNGIVFKITRTGKLTTFYKFCSQTNCADGSSPEAGLVQATDGNFYGTTINGGAHGEGSIFQITPSGTLTTLYSFCSQTGCPDGLLPFGAFLQATDGTFYGTTVNGGDSSYCNEGCGTIFSLSMGLGPFVSFVRASGKVRAKVEILGQGFTGTTGVSFNGTAASYVVHSDAYLTATVPQGATTGSVTVTTPGGTLQSNVQFRVKP